MSALINNITKEMAASLANNSGTQLQPLGNRCVCLALVDMDQRAKRAER